MVNLHPGLSVDTIKSLLKDPVKFQDDLMAWAKEKDVVLAPEELWSFLQARLAPEKVTPVELITMLSDPRTAICDPKIVSRLIEAKNMTNDEVRASIKPLCNLSLDEALELIKLAESHVDWQQVQDEVKEFAVKSGGQELSFNDYKTLYFASEDIRRDLLQKESMKKVIGDVSNFLRTIREQMVMEVDSENSTANSFFMQNVSTQGRLAFAAFQRTVCGRNMSAAQFFSDGGLANRYLLL